jgi:hypothetical protein
MLLNKSYLPLIATAPLEAQQLANARVVGTRPIRRSDITTRCSTMRGDGNGTPLCSKQRDDSAVAQGFVINRILIQSSCTFPDCPTLTDDARSVYYPHFHLYHLETFTRYPGYRCASSSIILSSQLSLPLRYEVHFQEANKFDAIGHRHVAVVCGASNSGVYTVPFEPSFWTVMSRSTPRAAHCGSEQGLHLDTVTM